jgi:tryptophan synthase alpha chain
MTRLESTFARLRADRRTGLVTYVTAGDPDLARSAAILKALDRGGADVLEVGVPFSDPVADGPEIQRASERALRAGVTLDRVLDLIAGVRGDVAAPMVLFSYANPVLRMGEESFARRAAAAGADGVLLLDFPVEEAARTHEILTANGLAMIFLLSPTTTDERIAAAARLGRGFLYGISRLGVTGARDQVESGARQLAGRVRAITSLPLAVGFGISQPSHVQEVGTFADAAVVGSALVRVIAEHPEAPDLAGRVSGFVRWLKGGGQGMGRIE